MNKFIIALNFAAFLLSLAFSAASLLKRKKWGPNSLEGNIQYKSLNNKILLLVILFYTAPYIFLLFKSKTLNLESASAFIFAAGLLFHILINGRLFLVNNSGVALDYSFILWKNIKAYYWNENQLRLTVSTDWNETSYNINMNEKQKLTMIKLLNQYMNQE